MIHLLGAGSIGSLVAVNLAKGQVPVTLLLRGKKQVNKFTKLGGDISLKSQGQTYVANFPAEAQPNSIENLIVCVKCHQIKQAISSHLPLITPQTTLLVIHNGMGVEEELLSLWPKASLRPKIVYGLTSLGSKRLPYPWVFEHTGTAPIYLSAQSTKLRNLDLIKGMVSSTSLVPSKVLPYGDFLTRQYEKLVVNSVINPMTAILSVPNGDLLKFDEGSQLQRLTRESCSILSEYAAKYKAEYAQTIQQALDEKRMYRIVQQVCKDTATNTSSMRVDTENGNGTEIDYINGYIVDAAKKINRTAQQNRVLTNLVKMKTAQNKSMLESGYVPTLDLEL